jgi:hypothetical protein
LLVEHLVWRNRGQCALQAGCIGAVEKEFLPESLGQFDIFVIFLGRPFALATLLAQVGGRGREDTL